jgi:flagellar assembly protein FliH
LSFPVARGVTNLFDKVIKSENVELVNPAAGNASEFVRLYSKNKKDVRTSSGKEGLSGSDSSGTESASPIERTKKEAYAEGYTEGITKGKGDERRRLFQATESLVNTLRELDKLKKEILENNEDKILNLVFSISEKVISQEVSTKRDIVHNVIKSALQHAIDKEGIRIRLNTEDYRYIMEVNPGFIDSFDDIRNMTIVEDNAIRKGGVVIETSSGEVDARLEQQLNEIKKAVSGKR